MKQKLIHVQPTSKPQYLKFVGRPALRVDNLVEWQLIDESVAAVAPWFTHPFLHVLKDWDLSNKRVLEFGGGRSTRWWRTRAKWVTTIDTNVEWANEIERDCEGLNNGVLISLPINEGDQSRSLEYVNAGDAHGPYDIVIVDGILRYECLQKALSIPRPLTVIADNWQQAFVWISPPSAELMAPFEIHSFEQENHTNNDGVNKWKTVYWEL